MKSISKMFIAFAILFLSVMAHAGSWGAPVQIASYQIASGMNLAQMAGTPSITQASGSCSAGQVHEYYFVYSWLCYTPNLCRGGMRVYRQTCQ